MGVLLPDDFHHDCKLQDIDSKYFYYLVTFDTEFIFILTDGQNDSISETITKRKPLFNKCREWIDKIIPSGNVTEMPLSMNLSGQT